MSHLSGLGEPSTRSQPLPALGFVDVHPYQPEIHYLSQPPLLRSAATPDIPFVPTPHPPSVSTFVQAPLTVTVSLQAIQTSLAALHERMGALERGNAALLRQNRWWWTNELDEADDEALRARLPVRMPRRRLGVRIWWAIVAALRRGVVDLSLALVLMMIMGGGWRRARATFLVWYDRAQRLLRSS